MLSLLVLSIIFYLTHYLLFRDPHHIFIFLVGDIAFVPIEVLLVTLIIHRVLSEREKKALLKKLNMLIGAFFSELGIALIKKFSEFDTDCERIQKEVRGKSFTKKEYPQLKNRFRSYDCHIDIYSSGLEELRDTLYEKREFLLRMLENPNLFEHDTFTDLLWAVFHLTEELIYRKDLKHLSKPDSVHIAGDIKRAYDLIILEWLDYMKHLKENYPYLFSLAVRLNPFNPEASPEFADE
ncbi:MAG: hypothetical protein RQ767_07475 [Thermovirgaceae bacterium]|nr:hypothetical protein [Thermovirgaceae bacterium]